jgi:hypothetical protein
MVGARGFEPPTPSLPDWYANRAALRPDIIPARVAGSGYSYQFIRSQVITTVRLLALAVGLRYASILKNSRSNRLPQETQGYLGYCRYFLPFPIKRISQRCR